MPPSLVTLIRHGEALHNVTQDYSIPDPPLTPLGESQCRALATHFPPHPPVTLLVTSPLTRTVQTTLLSFAPVLAAPNAPPVLAHPALQETADNPCDTGGALEEKRQRWPHVVWDAAGVAWDGWNSKRGRWGCGMAVLEERARDVRRWLHERQEEHVVCVLHGGFLHYLTEDWSGSDQFPGTGWANTEFRSYRFAAEGEGKGGGWSLVETRESERRRVEKPLGRAETKIFEESVVPN